MGTTFRSLAIFLVFSFLLVRAENLKANEDQFLILKNFSSCQFILSKKKVDLKKLILNSSENEPLLIAVTASWCPYCVDLDKGLAHKLSSLSQQPKLIVLSVDKNRQSAQALMDKIEHKKQAVWCETQDLHFIEKLRLPTVYLITPKGIDTQTVGYSNSKLSVLIRRLKWLSARQQGNGNEGIDESDDE